MRKTTCLILLLPFALSLGFAGNSQAQAGYSVNDQITRFKDELKLDQDQSRKVALMLIKMDEQKTADETKYADNPEQLRKAGKARFDKLSEDLKPILTAEQYEQFTKMRFRPSGGDRTAQQIEELTTKLSLTEEQVTKLQAVYDKYTPQMGEMFRSLREGGADREEMREKMRSIRETMNKEIETFLTPEQVKQYQAYQEDMRNCRGPGGPGRDQGGN